MRATSPAPYSEGHAWVTVKGRFAPNLIEARPGERLRLVFRREETAACSERVTFPGLGKSVMLTPFEDVDVDLGPLPPGEHEFRCGIGALRGRILVRRRPAAAQAAAQLEVRGGRIVVRSRGRRSNSVATTDADPGSTTDARPRIGSYATSEDETTDHHTTRRSADEAT